MSQMTGGNDLYTEFCKLYDIKYNNSRLTDTQKGSLRTFFQEKQMNTLDDLKKLRKPHMDYIKSCQQYDLELQEYYDALNEHNNDALNEHNNDDEIPIEPINDETTYKKFISDFKDKNIVKPFFKIQRVITLLIEKNMVFLKVQFEKLGKQSSVQSFSDRKSAETGPSSDDLRDPDKRIQEKGNTDKDTQWMFIDVVKEDPKSFLMNKIRFYKYSVDTDDELKQTGDGHYESLFTIIMKMKDPTHFGNNLHKFILKDDDNQYSITLKSKYNNDTLDSALQSFYDAHKDEWELFRNNVYNVYCYGKYPTNNVNVPILPEIKPDALKTFVSACANTPSV